MNVKRVVFTAVITALLFSFVFCQTAFAATVKMDDFTAYSNAKALTDAWKLEAGDKLEQTIENVGPTGKAMRIFYPACSLFFSNIRLEKEIALPEGALGIEFWVQNREKPVVLTVIVDCMIGNVARGYRMNVNVPLTGPDGMYVHVEFAAAKLGLTGKDEPMTQPALRNFGFSIATEFQEGQKAPSGMIVCISDIKAVTSFTENKSAPVASTPQPTASGQNTVSSRPEESSQPEEVSQPDTASEENPSSQPDTELKNESSKAAAGNDPEQTKGPGAGLIAAIAGAVLLVAGAGAGTFFMIKKSNQQAVPEEITEGSSDEDIGE